MTEDYKLTADVLEMKTEVKSFNPFFHTETNKFVMETQLAIVTPYFTQSLNNIGLKGLVLPVPSWIQDLI